MGARIFLLTTLVGAGLFYSGTSWARSQCTTREREMRDCHLRSGALRVHIRQDKIHIDNGVWRQVEPLPDGANVAEWSKIGLRKLGGRQFLEILLWLDTPGGLGLQDLHWHVLEVVPEEKAKLRSRLTRIVQKRRKEGQEPAQSQRPWLADPIKKFWLKEGPHGQVTWQWANESGVF